MTIKVYISGICGSHEVRKHQQRVLFILQSLPIDLEIVDITEPGRDEDLIFMQEEAKKHDKKTQLPPQIFNGNDYCGDYVDFELANDDDEIMKFLKLETGSSQSEIANEQITQNGVSDHGNTQDTSEVLLDSISNNIEENAEKDPQLNANEENNFESLVNDNAKEDIAINDKSEEKSAEESD